MIRAASRSHVGAAKIDELLESARITVALTSAADVRRQEITEILERWALVRRQLATTDARIAATVATCAPARALATIPEVGPVRAATLVAELGDPQWYEAPRQVLKLAGMNLARRESGTSVRGRLRQTKRGRPLLRRQLFLLAGRWCQKRGLYRADYEALLRRGKSRTSAVCAVARKLVPMLLRVMQTTEPFELATWWANRLERRDQVA